MSAGFIHTLTSVTDQRFSNNASVLLVLNSHKKPLINVHKITPPPPRLYYKTVFIINSYAEKWGRI